VGEYRHEPVLVREVLEALAVRPGGLWVDATIGGGGHAAAVLAASAPDGRLIGCDWDPEAVAAARERLREFGERAEIHEGRYVDLPQWVAPGSATGVLADLGVSSWQLDAGDRGFSIRADAPLDMRFSRRGGRTAAEWLNQATVTEMETILREWGGEPRARQLARALDAARRRAPLRTTGQLAAVVEQVLPRRGARRHPATRVFQALRIAVNDELAQVAAGLRVLWDLLAVGGRMVIVAYHSGEARLVKRFARGLGRDYEVTGEVDRPEFRRPRPRRLRRVYPHAVRPSRAEARANPRSRSALLYAFEKIGE
jgi:16S rRNA (cytosine1402-N4)-methyltransferase